MEWPSMSGGMGLTGWTGGFGGQQSGGGTDWGSLIGGALSGIGSIMAARTMARSQPSMGIPGMMGVGPLIGAAGSVLGPVLRGGAAVGGALAIPDLLGGLLGGGGQGPVVSATPGVFAGGPMDAFRTSFYTAGRQSFQPIRTLPVTSPTGRLVYWRYVGPASEFAGDRAIAKNWLKKHGGSRARVRGKRRR